MEAEWEFEVGGDAPLIESCWPGFVDLRRTPERAHDLPEAALLPGLAETLKRLNSEPSPVSTSKCDFWPTLEPEDFNSDELDAPPGCSLHAMCCYIDLLAKEERAWSRPSLAERVCKRLCTLLGAVPLRCCRVDLIVRRALIVPDLIDFGVTAYISACGPSTGQAKERLESALAAFAHVLCAQSTLQ
jgi:hypothetical protein